MNEEELFKVSSLLEELVGNEEKQPSNTKVKVAIWEVCGDSGALQLLVDLLQTNCVRFRGRARQSDSQCLEIRLAKAEAINWTSLEYTKGNTVQHKLNSPSG